MRVLARNSDVGRAAVVPFDEKATLLRMEKQLPPLLSVIAQ
jgi:hypothetical protein